MSARLHVARLTNTFDHARPPRRRRPSLWLRLTLEFRPAASSTPASPDDSPKARR